jgi:hypothetical protein
MKILLVLSLLIAATLPCRGMASPGPAPDDTHAVGLNIGYFAPIGDWKAHRYAEGVDLLKGGFTIGGELEGRLIGINLALFMNYTRFRLNDWIDYARSQGDNITATTSMVSSGLLAKIYFMRSRASFMDFDLGFAYCAFNGHESYDTDSYEYTFLQNRGGMIFGLGFWQTMSPSLALTLNMRALLVFEGVRYADGLQHDVFGMPLTAGLRYLF